MTEFQAKKVYLKDGEGDYIVPVAYSAKYVSDGLYNREISDSYDATSHNGMSGIALASAISQSMTELTITSGTVTLDDNQAYKIIPTDTIIFTLPNISDYTVLHQILVQIQLNSILPVNVGTTYYFNKTAPDLSEIGVYDLIFEYDNNSHYWVCGLLTKGVVS